ncbi:MAG: hypothetical protein ACI89L_002129 [Phycisphaerales bacterium]|jgi:hypothetical protein
MNITNRLWVWAVVIAASSPSFASVAISTDYLVRDLNADGLNDVVRLTATNRYGSDWVSTIEVFLNTGGEFALADSMTLVPGASNDLYFPEVLGITQSTSGGRALWTRRGDDSGGLLYNFSRISISNTGQLGASSPLISLQSGPAFFGDFDQDGNDDLVLLDPATNNVLIHHADNSGNLAVESELAVVSPAEGDIRSMHLMDLNHDGVLEIGLVRDAGPGNVPLWTEFTLAEPKAVPPSDPNDPTYEYTSIAPPAPLRFTDYGPIIPFDTNNDGFDDVVLPVEKNSSEPAPFNTMLRFDLTAGGAIDSVGYLDAVCEHGGLRAILDVDNDGSPDLLWSGTTYRGYPDTIQCRLSDGSRWDTPVIGSFTSGTIEAFGEFTGDGTTDVLVDVGGEPAVIPGNGDGTFGTNPIQGVPFLQVGDGATPVFRNVRFAGDLREPEDYTGDGRDDLLISGVRAPRQPSVASLYEAMPDGSFNLIREMDGSLFEPEYSQASSTVTLFLAYEDMDNDGNRDAVRVSKPDTGEDTLYYVPIDSNGISGTPSGPIAGGTNVNVVFRVTDANSDGLPDVLVTISNGATKVLANDGSGGLAQIRSYRPDPPLSGVAPPLLVDIDQDGCKDIVFIDGSGNWAVFLSLCDGRYMQVANGPIIPENLSGSGCPRVFAVNANGDAFPDLVIETDCGQSKNHNTCVVMNNGDGTFAAAVPLGAEVAPRFVYDIDGDGYDEFVSTGLYVLDGIETGALTGGLLEFDPLPYPGIIGDGVYFPQTYLGGPNASYPRLVLLSHFEGRLYFPKTGFEPGCPADLNGDGIYDSGDIQVFIAFFFGGNLAVDLNGDGILDNGDIGAFITAFLAGC